MEERRVSFAAQNELDAEQAFLNSMKALQDLDEGGASPAAAIEASVQDDGSVSDGSVNGMDIGEGHGAALVGDTEDQEATPHSDNGASANIGTTIDASATSASSGPATPVVKPDGAQEIAATSAPSTPSTASSHRRAAAPFSYDEDEDDDTGHAAAAVTSDENGDTSAKSTVATATPTPSPTPPPPAAATPTPAPSTSMEASFSNGHHVSVTPPVSAVPPFNSNPTFNPSVSLVVAEDTSTPQTSTQNATPMSTTDEIQQSSSIAGASQEQPQPSMGVISSLSSSIAAVPSTPDASAAVSTPIASTAAAPSSHKRKRLPQDRVGLLEDRIAEDARGDLDAWFSLIAEHQKKGKFDEARAVFERFFLVFPACVRSKISLCLYLLRILCDMMAFVLCCEACCILRQTIANPQRYRPSNGLPMLRWNFPTMNSSVLSKFFHVV